MESIVTILLRILGVYLLIGLIFGILFAFAGVKKIDPAAAESGFGFKLLIIPGSMVFWPLLAKRWAKALRPQQNTAPTAPPQKLLNKSACSSFTVSHPAGHPLRALALRLVK